MLVFQFIFILMRNSFIVFIRFNGKLILLSIFLFTIYREYLVVSAGVISKYFINSKVLDASNIIKAMPITFDTALHDYDG